MGEVEENIIETSEEQTVEEPAIDLNSDKQIADLQDRLHRNLAEFDNFRKRSTKEKLQMFDEGVKDTVEKILPVMDNFELALKNLDENDGFAKGIIMIHQQLVTSLQSIGVNPIETIGKTFDTNYHQAVSTITNDNYEAEQIVEELQKGYMYKDKIIRHSMVIVAN